MSYVILKQLTPALADIPEELQYIDWCTCIPGDEKYQFDALQEAEAKVAELSIDERYTGRNLKIKECQ